MNWRRYIPIVNMIFHNVCTSALCQGMMHVIHKHAVWRQAHQIPDICFVYNSTTTSNQTVKITTYMYAHLGQPMSPHIVFLHYLHHHTCIVDILVCCKLYFRIRFCNILDYVFMCICLLYWPNNITYQVVDERVLVYYIRNVKNMHARCSNWNTKLYYFSRGI